jgi:hypothetical protein
MQSKAGLLIEYVLKLDPITAFNPLLFLYHSKLPLNFKSSP